MRVQQNNMIKSIEMKDDSEEEFIGEDVGTKRDNMEDEEIEQFSDEEVVVEVQDPYQQWYNKRVFNEVDEKKTKELL